MTPPDRSVQCHRLHLKGPDLATERDILRSRYEAAVKGAVRCDANQLTIGQLVALFMEHGTADFSASRRGTIEAQNYTDATRELLHLYSDLPAIDFDVLHLKAVRLMMIDQALCRETINRHRIRRIRTIIRWATEHHGLDARVIARLTAMKPLRPNVNGVREAPPTKAATLEQIMAVLRDSKCPMVNRAMLMLQGSCGARPGEVCMCHEMEINQAPPEAPPLSSPHSRLAKGGGGIWLWTPSQHKNLWRGKQRIIPIGESGQLACLPYLGRGYLFQTKAGRAGVGGRPFRVDHYHQMIEESCRRQGIERFSPQAVRRFTAEQADALYDAETAQELLSHSDLRTTEIYLRRAGRRAVKFAREHG